MELAGWAECQELGVGDMYMVLHARIAKQLVRHGQLTREVPGLNHEALHFAQQQDLVQRRGHRWCEQTNNTGTSQGLCRRGQRSYDAAGGEWPNR